MKTHLLSFYFQPGSFLDASCSGASRERKAALPGAEPDTLPAKQGRSGGDVLQTCPDLARWGRWLSGIVAGEDFCQVERKAEEMWRAEWWHRYLHLGGHFWESSAQCGPLIPSPSTCEPSTPTFLTFFAFAPHRFFFSLVLSPLGRSWHFGWARQPWAETNESFPALPFISALKEVRRAWHPGEGGDGNSNQTRL